MEIGIVGLPNVGKSSLFNALTKGGAQAANFPFTTIEPNVGIVEVPDNRLDFLVSTYKSAKRVPAFIKFVDIAGLVKGASQGEGLGNQFLSHIRSVDAIAQVVRVFNDEKIIHVSGDINPENDIVTINTELVLADLEQATKMLEGAISRNKKGDKEATLQMPLLQLALAILDNGQPLRTNPDLAKSLVSCNFLTAKPLLYIANTGELPDENLVATAKAMAGKEGAKFISLCVKAELEVTELSPEEEAEFRKELGLSSGLDDLIETGYQLLNLETFFTAGPTESHAWTITKNTKAPQAAGKIHTDFERGFIRAEIFNVEDLKKFGSEKAIREAGRLRSEGKEYIVKDGDVIEFLFNV